MTSLTLATAQSILAHALAAARAANMKPLAVGVVDATGQVIAFAKEDGTAGSKRSEVALGKARGALAVGVGSRSLMKTAETRPHFMTAMQAGLGVPVIPVPGGVLIKTSDGTVIGAVGVSGCTSDNDEAVALAGIASVGLVGDGG